ncbi:uncharacterized protein K452DRAFT_307953 [Aplosporella prunicola CBS 121167]|uniref:Uncharacterized protein n=1 Tax=Aplosporella prunicola CBS 121167 TaxID=1176127 RepID=A0A6A6BJS6_9PEZI|nr:uncharacterized protein K452DRAFT_307953 [Aplosporella prunicola CBS 121167]KAF2143077.1 hypothetical protein K452DRAFT_307953 [Aplosporella prunicola CBS 121167]
MGNAKKGGVAKKKRGVSKGITKKDGKNKTKNKPKSSNPKSIKAGDTTDPEKSDDVVEKHLDNEYTRIVNAVDGTHHLLGDEVLNANGVYHGQVKTEIQQNHEHLQSQLTVNPADLALPMDSDVHQKDLLKARKKFNEWNQYIERGGLQGRQEKPLGD